VINKLIVKSIRQNSSLYFLINLFTLSLFRLHDEIKAFYEDALPTADEANRRERVVAKITQVVKNRWSGAKVR